MAGQSQVSMCFLSLTAIACASCGVLLGCSLDTRSLELAAAVAGAGGRVVDPPTQAGASSAGSGGSAGDDASAGSGGSAGSAGASAESPQIVDGCADLDQNRVADCTETIVKNPDLKQDVADWSADSDTTVDWDSENALGDLPSGSALVASLGVIDPNGENLALRAAQQCVAVTAKKLLTVYANAFVDEGQDAQGHAEVDVFFFDREDCQGQATPGFSTPQPTDAPPGAWLTLKAGAIVSDTTKSALIKLAVAKPFRAASFQARFDNVLVRLQTP